MKFRLNDGINYHYTQRVRYLCHDEAPKDDDKSAIKVLTSSSYHLIRRNTTNGFIFLSNLRSFTWRIGTQTQSVSHAALITSGSNQELHLSLWDARVSDLTAIFKHLRGRMPDIISLVIDGEGTSTVEVADSEVLSEPLSELLSDFKHQSRITIFHWLFSEPVLNSLGSLPRLYKVDCPDWYLLPATPRPWYNGFHLGEPSSFAALEHLDVTMELKEATYMFQGIRRALNLGYFSIWVIRHATRAELREFAEALVIASPGITNITISLMRFYEESVAAEQIHLDDLAPHYRAKLTHFKIHDADPIGGTDTKIIELAKAWLGLLSLSLTSIPMIPDPNNPPIGLGLMALSAIASHRPDLQELSLYVNIGRDVRNIGVDAQFHNLKKLDLGRSILYPEVCGQVATFLATLISPFCDAKFVAKVHRPQNSDLSRGIDDGLTAQVTAIRTHTMSSVQD